MSDYYNDWDQSRQRDRRSEDRDEDYQYRHDFEDTNRPSSYGRSSRRVREDDYVNNDEFGYGEDFGYNRYIDRYYGRLRNNPGRGYDLDYRYPRYLEYYGDAENHTRTRYGNQDREYGEYTGGASNVDRTNENRDYDRDYEYDVYREGQGSGRFYNTYEEWNVPGPYSGRGPKGYHRSDEQIREDIFDRLTQHGQIDASDMDVQVNNGEVTLTGSVDNRRIKRMAEDTALSVRGVNDVNNELKVKYGSRGITNKQNMKNEEQQK